MCASSLPPFFMTEQQDFWCMHTYWWSVTQCDPVIPHQKHPQIFLKVTHSLTHSLSGQVRRHHLPPVKGKKGFVSTTGDWLWQLYWIWSWVCVVCSASDWRPPAIYLSTYLSIWVKFRLWFCISGITQNDWSIYLDPPLTKPSFLPDQEVSFFLLAILA